MTCSAWLDPLGRLSPYLNRETWDTGKLADVGRDHSQAMGKTCGCKPEIIRPNHLARCGQFCPHLRMRSGGRQIYRQQGKAL